MPPITCTSCRVTIDERRYRIWKDGSVSSSLTKEEMERMQIRTMKDLLDYELTTAKLSPDSLEAKTIRRESQRLRKNKNARERNQAMKDIGLKKTSYGWE